MVFLSNHKHAVIFFLGVFFNESLTPNRIIIQGMVFVFFFFPSPYHQTK